MPVAPRSVCTSPNCGRLAAVGRTRCDQHHAEWIERRAAQQTKAHAGYNAKRPKSDSFYSTNAWKKKSEAFRKRYPLCSECESIGLVVQCALVDHKIAYRLRPDLGLVDSNLRSLCWQCHNRIGAKVRPGADGVESLGVKASAPYTGRW